MLLNWYSFKFKRHVHDVKNQSINEQEHVILERCVNSILYLFKCSRNTIPKYEHNIAPHVWSASILTRIVQTVLCWFQDQHNTVCTILVKIDVLNTCGAMICSYFGIVFLLLRVSDSATEDRECCLHMFPK